MAPVGYWLVYHRLPGDAASMYQTPTPEVTVEQLPSGQHPIQAAWKDATGHPEAVYLGPTTADVQKWLTKAAGEMGVPDVRKVPSIGQSVALTLAAATAAVGGAVTNATRLSALGALPEAGGTSTATTAGEGALGGAAAKGAAQQAGKAAAATGLAALLGASGWSELAVRGLEALAGFALLLLGLQALTGQGAQTPAAQVRHLARRASKVAR